MKPVLIGLLLIFVVVVPARGQVASSCLLREVKDQLAAQTPRLFLR
ncbi:MAG TPA: hypothetical protein VM095_05390 [Pyrinomonadaceae bacterium]|nr:hypothetical protein [Pyrinomonadaceae bacterium]